MLRPDETEVTKSDLYKNMRIKIETGLKRNACFSESFLFLDDDKKANNYHNVFKFICKEARQNGWECNTKYKTSSGLFSFGAKTKDVGIDISLP